MARLTRPHPGAGRGSIEVREISPETLDGARPLLSVISLADGQVATWPFDENLIGLDTEDVDRLCECVRLSLMRLVRPQG